MEEQALGANLASWIAHGQYPNTARSCALALCRCSKLARYVLKELAKTQRGL